MNRHGLKMIVCCGIKYLERMFVIYCSMKQALCQVHYVHLTLMRLHFEQAK